MTTTGLDMTNTYRLKTSSASLFGQVEYEFAPRWKAVVGGRVIREHQSYDFVSAATPNLNPWAINPVTASNALFTLQPSYANSRTATLWTGKAQVEYRPSRDLLLYAGINRGVKGGSYNAKLPDGTAALAPSDVPYRPEVLVSYEGGFKLTFLGGKGTFNSSAYYYDYSDYQGFTFQNVSGFVQNADARTYGAEAELNFRPVTGLQVSLSASLFDAKVKHLQVAPTVFRDVRPSFAPRSQFAGRVTYTPPIEVAGGKIPLGGDFNHTAGAYDNLQNFDSQWLPGYTLVNAQIGWKDAAERYRVGFFVSNLTDKTYRVTGYDLSTLCGCSEIAYGRPRWWGITAGFTFK